MNIDIEVQNTTGQKTGVGTYTCNLIKYLQKFDKKNQYKLVLWRLFFKVKIEPVKLTGHNFNYKFIRIMPFRAYNKLFKFGLRIPLNLFVGTSDIFVFSNFIRYPISKSKSIIIIYDLSYLKYPQFGELKNVKFLTKMVPQSIHKADRIVTISENSRKEIIEAYKVPAEKISIVYPAVDYGIFRPMEKKLINEIREKYNLTKDYFLFASTLEPRKNIIGIIKAYISLPEGIKSKYDLVLAGGKGWQDQEILAAIKKAQKEGNRIVTLGYVPENHLPALYSGAYLFLYPSFYEGFGIPILEAMACGTPVITSNTSSMPEVAGNAALLVDPKDIGRIKGSIIKVVNDIKLREDLIKKGLDQAKKFSWGQSAKELVKVFKKVYRG